LILREALYKGGVGPFAFITHVNHCTLGHANCVLKYDDDFSLIVPENNDVFAASEMTHIISWSESNRLKINLAKCKELVFNRPNHKHDISPCTLPNVVRVNSVKLLGVYLDHTLCFHEHDVSDKCLKVLLLFSHVVCTNHCIFHLLGKDNSQLQLSL